MKGDELFAAIVAAEPTAFRRLEDGDGVVHFATSRYPNLITSVSIIPDENFTAHDAAKVALHSRKASILAKAYQCEDKTQPLERWQS